MAEFRANILLVLAIRVVPDKKLVSSYFIGVVMFFKEVPKMHSWAKKLGRNKTCAPQFSPQFDRGCFKWATCATRIYIKWLGTRDRGDPDEHFRLQIRYVFARWQHFEYWIFTAPATDLLYFSLFSLFAFARPSQTLRSFRGNNSIRPSAYRMLVNRLPCPSCTP